MASPTFSPLLDRSTAVTTAFAVTLCFEHHSTHTEVSTSVTFTVTASGAPACISA
ncbi:MAG: hypothetical protein H6704_27235 [Myxococcales bacterium]|nr:hypothetical protein [Myxococcales bacterium]